MLIQPFMKKRMITLLFLSDPCVFLTDILTTDPSFNFEINNCYLRKEDEL